MKPVFEANSQSSFDRNIRIDNIPVLKTLNEGELGMCYSHSKLKAIEEKGENVAHLP